MNNFNQVINALASSHAKLGNHFYRTFWSRLPLLIGVLGLTLNLQAGKPTPPLAPSSLSAVAVSSSQINLAWQDNSSDENGFTIERAPSASGSWSQIASVGANVKSYSNSGLSAATTYYYRVYASNSRGSSPYSNTAGATTQQSAVGCSYSISPTSASFTSSGGNGSVSVSAGAGCARSATSGASWITITSGSSGTGSGTVGYAVAANTSTSARAGTMTIAGYTFTVSQAAASGGGGGSDVLLTSGVPYNDALSATAPQTAWKYYYIDVPSGSSSLVVDLYNMTADVDLYIKFNAKPTLSFWDCRPYIGGTSEQCSFSTPAAGRWWIGVNNYAAGTINYTVKASLSAGAAPADTTAPSVPTGLAASAASSSQINLSWNVGSDTGGSGLAGYRVYRSGVLLGTTVGTGYSSTGLSPSTTYCFTVAAYDNAGNTSGQSAQACATTAGGSDTVAPSTSLTAPGSGATVSGTITLSASASDNVGVSRVDFYCDGGTLVGSDTSSPYSITCNTTTIPNGSRYFNCRAYDAAGNWTSSANVPVTVSNGSTGTPGQSKSAIHLGGLTIADKANIVSAEVDGSGNMFVAGWFSGSVNFGGTTLTSLNGASGGGFLAKYTAGGTLVWVKNLSGTLSNVSVSKARVETWSMSK